MNMKNYNILVIGGGPAAISLVKTIKGVRQVAVIRPEDHSMIYCAMPYAIEGLIPFEKTLKKDQLITDNQAELIRDEVTAVNFSEKIVRGASGDTYGYENLVIATGASPILPPIEGSKLDGVYTFKTENDLAGIMEVLEKGVGQAVVVGAGAIGIELAQALKEKGLITHLVDIAPRILPNMTDPEMTEEAEAHLIEKGIKLHLDKGVTKLKGQKYLEEVVLEKGNSIHFYSADECSLGVNHSQQKGILVFAVGMKPNVEIFNGTNLSMDRGGIVVNEKMETNIPGVYAAGDCTHFISGITKEGHPGKLATNAVPMGKVLARILLGEDTAYRGFYNGAATKAGDYYVGSTGFTESQAAERFDIITTYSEFTTAFPIMPFAKKVRMKLIVDAKTGCLIGGQVVSGLPVTDKIDQITMAIQWKIPVEELVHLSYSSQPYQSFFPANNLLVQAALEATEKLRKRRNTRK